MSTRAKRLIPKPIEWKPLQDYVVLEEPVDGEPTGRIVVPATVRGRAQQMVIIAVGPETPGHDSWDGTDLIPGDRVLVLPDTGIESRLGDRSVRIVRICEILCVWTPPDPED